MSTLRDIAVKAGVAVSTASLALNGDTRVKSATRQRVLDAASALDYHPSRAAKSLSSGRTWSLHLFDFLSDGGLSSSFFTRFVRGVHDVVHSHSYTLALTVLEDEAEASEALNRLIRERWTDGVILMNLSEEERLLSTLLSHNFPHVLLGHSERAGVWSVDSDNEAVARDATRHLLGRGRGPVLFLNGPARHAFVQERARGYRQVHAEFGDDPQETLLQFDLGSAQEARERIGFLLREGLAFGSVLTASDALAVGALRGLRDADKRVPNDVAVVGMNNDDLTEYTDPPLTSVELNAHALGREAAQSLLASLAGAAPQRRLVPHRLVVRASSGD